MYSCPFLCLQTDRVPEKGWRDKKYGNFIWCYISLTTICLSDKKCLFNISSSLGAGEIGYSKSIVRRALEHISYIQYTVTTCIWGSMVLHIWLGWPGSTYICQDCFYSIFRDCSIAKCVKNAIRSKPFVSFEICLIENPKYTRPHATSQGREWTKDPASEV